MKLDLADAQVRALLRALELTAQDQDEAARLALSEAARADARLRARQLRRLRDEIDRQLRADLVDRVAAKAPNGEKR